MFVVTVKFTIEANFIDDFLVAMHKQAADSLRDEPDCQRFDICTSIANQHQFFLYEVYSSADSFDAHLQSEHFKQFDLAVKQWITSKVVETFSLRR